jgi:chemotaxis protein methyltransferase CheR
MQFPFQPLSPATDEFTEELFRSITGMVEEYCGLHFDDDARYILHKRVDKRMAALQMDSYRKYYYFLLYDPEGRAELDVLVELLTTPETYFFREKPQLKAFSDELLPMLMQRLAPTPRKTIRLWSAGCASGEEPYTIAMLVLEKRLPPGWKVEIFASDINRVLLQRARTGVYREHAFRTTEDGMREKYFERHDEKNWRVKDSVRQLISFGRVNLFDMARPLPFGMADVIFCRNVIIYFTKDGKRRVVEGFYEHMEEGGFLLLGHSESLLNISTRFKLLHLKNDMVYQK